MSIFLDVLRSEGLAHLSYILGQGREAVVIDPRRDIGAYLDIADRRSMRITRIFETHRNEDYVIGSMELARATQARIYHGHAFAFAYGEPVQEGDSFDLGSLRLEILETPGHTDESISIVVKDTDFGNEPVAVFTGDTLFVGDVGRTDFFPDRKEEVAGLLYDSIFGKLLELGDQTIIYPAHGAGSVCGSGMADREFSTIGYERRNNRSLQVQDRQAFIRKKVAEHHYQSPYFRKMEEFNMNGTAPDVGVVRPPAPMAPDDFESAMDSGMQVVDCRLPEAFAGAFIPGSLAIPLSLIPVYAGYFLDYDHAIGLIAHDVNEAKTAFTYLLRIGYDNVRGYLVDGLTSWETSGKKYDQIRAVHTGELVRRIQDGAAVTILDVRKQEEFDDAHLPGAQHVFLGHLMDRLDGIPKDKPVTTFCGSGTRAIVAASILKQAGFDDVEDALGSIAACASIGCPLESSGVE